MSSKETVTADCRHLRVRTVDGEVRWRRSFAERRAA
jgi:hypothetical protein